MHTKCSLLVLMSSSWSSHAARTARPSPFPRVASKPGGWGCLTQALESGKGACLVCSTSVICALTRQGEGHCSGSWVAWGPPCTSLRGSLWFSSFLRPDGASGISYLEHLLSRTIWSSCPLWVLPASAKPFSERDTSIASLQISKTSPPVE